MGCEADGADEVAQVAHKETAVVVDGASDTFGQQAGRKDAPQRQLGQSVHKGVTRGALESHRATPQSLAGCEQQAAEDIEQQGIHDVGHKLGIA